MPKKFKINKVINIDKECQTLQLFTQLRINHQHHKSNYWLRNINNKWLHYLPVDSNNKLMIIYYLPRMKETEAKRL